MKVLIVSQFFWPENFRINDLAKELKQRDHEVTILTGIPNYPSGKWFEGYSLKSIGLEIREGIKIIRVPLIPRFSSRKWQLALNYLSFSIAASFLGFFYCREKYDIIFTYAPSPLTVAIPAVILKIFKRIPMVIWVQDLWPEVFKAVEVVRSKLFYDLVEVMMKWIYKHSDMILVQSKDFIRPITAIGVEENRVLYFPNWAEELYKPIKQDSLSDEVEELSLITKDRFTAMFAGNLGEAQSLETIVGAAENLKNNQLVWVILGDGRKRNWLENEVKKRNLQNTIYLLGHRPVETMPFYFSLADVLLVTLKPHPVMSSWIPGKVQSYLACAKPIIGALDGAGAKVIQESGAGFSVKPGDSLALSRRVLQLSRLSKQSQVEMGRSALHYYNSEFNRKKLVSKLENHFSDLAKTGH